LSEADSFLLAIDALQKKGFSEVNWNLGCPSRGVIKKGKGAGLMPRTSHILGVLDKVLARTDIQISLKLRMGLYESEELFRLLPSLRDYPLNRVILHPRLGTQMYTGSVDLDGFQKALDLYGKQICYNGDINSGLDFLALQKRFPSVDEWMIGRGLVANPFLLKEILQFNNESGCSGDQLDNPFKQKAFYDFLEDLYGRVKEKITRKEAFWNYFKGILIYSFSHSYIPPEKRKELFRIRIEEDWFRLKNSLQLLYLDQ
jgi:tRNA-dihydrouridine synthase